MRARGGGGGGRTLEGRGRRLFSKRALNISVCVVVCVHRRAGVQVAGCVREVPPWLLRWRYDNYTGVGEARRGEEGLAVRV